MRLSNNRFFRVMTSRCYFVFQFKFATFMVTLARQASGKMLPLGPAAPTPSGFWLTAYCALSGLSGSAGM